MEPARSRSRPPLDPTVAPSVTRIPVREASVTGAMRVAVRRPVLASECLKDDVAPLEPHAVGFRIATGVLAIASTAAVLLGGPFVLVGSCGAATAGAMLFRDYERRARFALLASTVSVCAATFALSARGAELLPLVLRVAAPIALAVALFARATYRAHRVTRVALAVSLPLFVVAAAFAGGAFLLPGLPRLAGAGMSVVALLSLLGFMSDQTTGGCAAWSGLALVTGLGAVVLDRREAAWMVPALFVALAAIAVAISLFQAAAQRIAPTERARDTRGSLEPPPPEET